MGIENGKAVKWMLGISGVLICAVGLGILCVPHELHRLNGVILPAEPSLLSEIRAPGGALVALGGLVLVGLWSDSLRFFALLLSTLLFLSFGGGRLVSVALDGAPASALWIAMIAELVLGLVGVGILWKYRQGAA